MEDTFLIVGLGNPGKKYECTRHNVGFEAVDVLAQKLSISVAKIKFKGLLGEARVDGKRIVLLKPSTFMNLSGESVMEAVNWYKIDVKNLIVIYDDIDIEPFKIKIRPKGSSGSHNGMKNIIYLLNSDGFPRVRIGVGKPHPQQDLASFVLSGFGKEEVPFIEEAIVKASEAALAIVKNGVDSAMNIYNP